MKKSITILSLILLVGCAKTDTITENNGFSEYCHNVHQYCINIPKELSKHPNTDNITKDGLMLLYKDTDVKIVFGGETFDKNERSVSYQQFKEMLLPMVIKDTKNNDKGDLISSEENITDDTATFIRHEKDKTTYRYFKYNQNRYVDIFFTYGNKHKSEIEPIIQQMTQSIVLK